MCYICISHSNTFNNKTRTHIHTPRPDVDLSLAEQHLCQSFLLMLIDNRQMQLHVTTGRQWRPLTLYSITTFYFVRAHRTNSSLETLTTLTLVSPTLSDSLETTAASTTPHVTAKVLFTHSSFRSAAACRHARSDTHRSQGTFQGSREQ